jgi:hypothetical protein
MYWIRQDRALFLVSHIAGEGLGQVGFKSFRLGNDTGFKIIALPSSFREVFAEDCHAR